MQARTPPHFTRDDLEQITEWEHTDIWWLNRAMEGVNEASDEKIIRVTTGLGRLDVSVAIRPLIGAFRVSPTHLLPLRHSASRQKWGTV